MEYEGVDLASIFEVICQGIYRGGQDAITIERVDFLLCLRELCSEHLREVVIVEQVIGISHERARPIPGRRAVDAMVGPPSYFA